MNRPPLGNRVARRHGTRRLNIDCLEDRRVLSHSGLLATGEIEPSGRLESEFHDLRVSEDVNPGLGHDHELAQTVQNDSFRASVNSRAVDQPPGLLQIAHGRLDQGPERDPRSEEDQGETRDTSGQRQDSSEHQRIQPNEDTHQLTTSRDEGPNPSSVAHDLSDKTPSSSRSETSVVNPASSQSSAPKAIIAEHGDSETHASSPALK